VPDAFVSKATMLADSDQLLTDFAPRYKRITKKSPHAALRAAQGDFAPI
jgi:hypothetical protein